MVVKKGESFVTITGGSVADITVQHNWKIFQQSVSLFLY